tara:strand:+ start:957 stop:1373 length:417 start_codon:yes stop_codon:yes gene_type:complete
MKKVTLVIVFLVFVSFKSFAQFGVSIHQTNIPFVGFNYELKDKYMGELRFSTDSFFDNISPELVFTRFIKKDTDFNFYGGLGARLNIYEGLVVPIGLNIYPFEKKNFGFQMEIAPIIGDDAILRGTWGIRYRFGDRQK